MSLAPRGSGVAAGNPLHPTTHTSEAWPVSPPREQSCAVTPADPGAQGARGGVNILQGSGSLGKQLLRGLGRGSQPLPGVSTAAALQLQPRVTMRSFRVQSRSLVRLSVDVATSVYKYQFWVNICSFTRKNQAVVIFISTHNFFFLIKKAQIPSYKNPPLFALSE